MATFPQVRGNSGPGSTAYVITRANLDGQSPYVHGDWNFESAGVAEGVYVPIDATDQETWPQRTNSEALTALNPGDVVASAISPTRASFQIPNTELWYGSHVFGVLALGDVAYAYELAIVAPRWYAGTRIGDAYTFELRCAIDLLYGGFSHAEVSIDGEVEDLAVSYLSEPSAAAQFGVSATLFQIAAAFVTHTFDNPNSAEILGRFHYNNGYVTTWQRLYISQTNPNRGASILQHRLGPLLTAYGNGSLIRIFSRPDATNAQIEGYGFPTLFHAGDPMAGGPIQLCAQKRSAIISERDWWIFESTDVGHTWERKEMALDSTYTNVVACGTREGVQMLAAFDASKKLKVWRGAALVAVVDELSHTADLAIHQLWEIGSSDLVLFQAASSNGPAVTRRSKDGGKTWEVVA